MSDIASAVKNAERDYKEVEKELKSSFPEGSRRSPFFLSVKEDFRAYRESMAKLDKFNVSLDEDHRQYEDLFSVGLLKSIDALIEGDENWAKARGLANGIDRALTSALEELNKVGPLYQSLSSFVARIGEVVEFEREIESALRQSSREFENMSVRAQNSLRKLTAVDTSLTPYHVYANADSSRKLLEASVEALGSKKDSLALLRKSLYYLLRGKSKAGDEQRVWNLYRSIVEQNAKLTNEIVEISRSVVSQRDQLDNYIELIDEFSKHLSRMESGIVELRQNQAKSHEELEADRRRLLSLLDAAPAGFSPDDSPYRELKSTFAASESILSTTGGFVSEEENIKERFIQHVGKMKGLKSSDSQYDIFRNLGKEYDSVEKRAADQYEEFADASEAFKEVILDNFLNTPQYWELKYEVVGKKSFAGAVTEEENFGYIYDPSQYPDKPWHGKLISSFQLRLRKRTNKGMTAGDYSLLFEGTNNFPIEGMMLVEGDSVLFRISGDEVEIGEEKRKDGKVNFVWELPVERATLRQLVESQKLILKIHFLTVSHRVNLTLYRQKIFKEYEIPRERLAEWKRMLEGEKETS